MCIALCKMFYSLSRYIGKQNYSGTSVKEASDEAEYYYLPLFGFTETTSSFKSIPFLARVVAPFTRASYFFITF